MRTGLLGIVLFLVLGGCAGSTSHDTDVAAPQRYRPKGSEEQWLIEGKLDSEIRHDALGDARSASRSLTVTINGETAVQGGLLNDNEGMPAGTLDGSYGDSKVHVDCSSQRKTASWIEVRCRVLVDNEVAATLIM
jgi:hypothetical protein